jgi:hypothetical protein
VEPEPCRRQGLTQDAAGALTRGDTGGGRGTESHDGTRKPTLDRAADAYKALVDAGIIPAEWFERYRLKQFEEEFEAKNPYLNKTMQ